MNRYITGSMIKEYREESGLTQLQLAERLGVSDKTVSKWETGRGYPDITLVEPLASVLGLSVIELMTGESVCNTNRAANMLKSRFYVCPICGNIIVSAGEAVISCCGVTLPALEAEMPDAEHEMSIERVEDEYYVSLDHDMSKTHHISFLAAIRDDDVEIKKLYAEGAASARFKISGTKWLCCYCNKHGLFKVKVGYRNQKQQA